MSKEQIALTALEAIDKDRHAVGMSVHQILHVLHDYIPHACVREAEDKLFEAFFVNGIELTSNIMRKEYEEWKKHFLNVSVLTAKQPIQPLNEE